MSDSQIAQALSRPESYSPRPRQVELRETHISWVFLVGEHVYKLKKPLVLDFLDYGTPERRREMCEVEVRLNQRLAPHIYVGVRGVAPAGGRARLTDPDDDRATDYVVEMRRFDEHDTVSARLARGELTTAQVRRVGAALAKFHAQARVVSVAGSPALAAERQFDRNLHELLSCVDVRSEIGRALALERFAHSYITAHAAMFQARAERGCVREGHGDLRAEHVVLGRRMQIVDCVEFDPRLRELDVADELAFLVFDLTWRGGGRFAETLKQAYVEAGGDAGEDSLIAFYAAYRALVRAKIALARAAQRPSELASGEERARARDLIGLAERFAWAARLPLVIVVCGVPASGKSHLARVLAEASGLPHLSSDVTRKQLGGLRATERAAGGLYGADWNARTYAELGRRTAQALEAHRGAIVDATFRHRADRDAFAGALGWPGAQLFVECTAPEPVLIARATERVRRPAEVSDAGPAVVARERSSWQPLDELPAEAHLTLRTDRAVDAVLADLYSLLDQRLGRLQLAGQ